MKKFEVNLDAVVVIVLFFIAIVAVVFFQNLQYQRLFEGKLQVMWQLQDSQVDRHYFKGLYDNCRDFSENLSQ